MRTVACAGQNEKREVSDMKLEEAKREARELLTSPLTYSLLAFAVSCFSLGFVVAARMFNH
jgi:hypothetical protein